MSTPRRHRFEKKLIATARKQRLFAPGTHILVALSGGPDSTALVTALAALRDDGELRKVSACHVDHQLRAGSAADGEFCAALCHTLHVPLERARIVVAPGENVQLAARKARYRALRAAAERVGAERIATGHTRSDQAETVLHRLLRGAGARGLAGIPLRRGRIVRPLLAHSREEVLGYLRERGVAWREDPTNASPRYLRNRIRREVLPLLEGLAPGVERRLARTAELLRADDRALEREAAAVLGEPASSTEVSNVLARPLAVRRRIVRRLWREANGSRRHLGADHVDAVLALLRLAHPASARLPRGLEARVAYGVLAIGPPPAATVAFGPVLVEQPGRYDVPGRGTVEIGWRSAQPGPWPLELRTRRAGDRFRPASGGGGKKLKAWLIDQKVPQAKRGALLVVATQAGWILSIPELGACSAEAPELEVVLHR